MEIGFQWHLELFLIIGVLVQKGRSELVPFLVSSLNRVVLCVQ